MRQVRMRFCKRHGWEICPIFLIQWRKPAVNTKDERLILASQCCMLSEDSAQHSLCSLSALAFLAFLEQLPSWQRFLRMHFCFLVLIWVIEAVLRLDMRQCGHNASSSLNPGWRVWERLWIGPVWNTRSELVLLAFAKGWSVWCWEFLRV